LSYPRTSRAGARLRWAVLFGLIAALSLALTPGVADAKKGKKKRDTVKVMTQNLYLGSDLNPPVAAAKEGEGDATLAGAAARLKAFDHFANEVGGVLADVQANDFNVRAQTIAKEIKKNKVDLVGLQEAALWRLQFPTDGGGPSAANPNASLATTPLIDYIDTLLGALNNKAKTKKQCKAKGLKGNKCYRGYRVVVAQNEADIEQPGDFDNNPGPNGIGGEGPAFTTSGPAAGSPPCGNATFSTQETNPGADDTGVFLGDPGPPNNGTTGASFDPVTGELTKFDWNGDSNTNTRHDGTVAALNCGPDTFAPAVFGDAGTISPTTGWGPYASDCPDNNPLDGQANPAEGAQDKHDTTSSCLFHGIDGDGRLTMRDLIIARNGAGVKTSNATSGHYSDGSTLKLPIFNGNSSVAFTRGWTAVDVNVRGKKFHLVNTHLESENNGTIREDQAAELVASGGPASVNPTVLIGDLNSDPNSANPESPPAFLRLAAAGFRSLTGATLTSGHGELLNDLGNLLDNSRIDHILTNSPAITFTTSAVLDGQGGGLWASDHGGVLSRLLVPGGKKKK
jgi:endonuclease/exonuclease/phosphatase family metal-dependent hydrolase